MGCTLLLLFTAFASAGADPVAWRRFPACIHTPSCCCCLLGPGIPCCCAVLPLADAERVECADLLFRHHVCADAAARVQDQQQLLAVRAIARRGLLWSDQPERLSSSPSPASWRQAGAAHSTGRQPKECDALLVCCRWWEARKDVGQLVSLVHDLVRQVWGVGRLFENRV